jgi:hypothetical protein
MRLVLLASCTLLVMGVVSAAGDRVYRWKGADGKIYYGDTPPSSAQDVRNIDNKFSGPANASAPPQPLPLTEEQVAAREADCANKRSQLKSYRNATRLIERDALGREREYSLEERQQLVAKVEAEIQTQCGDALPE